MKRILHIDASPAVRKAVAQVLTPDHVLTQTASGVAGTRQATQTIPSLILIGRSTGDLDAYETTLRLRAIEQLARVPIVLMAPRSERRACFAAGADGVISGGEIDDGFASQLERYLRGHRDAEDTGEIDLREHSHRIVKRLEAKVVELSEANARLEEMARLRREFLRNVTHELATPMTPIVGYLKLLLGRDLGELTPLQEKGLLSVRRSVVHLRELIETLLDVSAFERGRLHVYDRPYDFRAVVQTALSQARENSPDAMMMLEPGRPLPARGDPDKLRRAMAHVLRNALKFSPRGAPVHLAIGYEGDILELSVTDSGPGVDAEEMARILEPFYQTDGSETRTHDGVGLGLAFALQVAQGHGGSLRIESPPPGAARGTRVRFRVKAFVDEEQGDERKGAGTGG